MARAQAVARVGSLPALEGSYRGQSQSPAVVGKTHRVGAVDRRGRAAQHLDALDLVRIEIRQIEPAAARGRRVVRAHAVDEDEHVIRIAAADVHRTGATRAAELVDLQTRHLPEQIDSAGHVTTLDLLASDDRHVVGRLSLERRHAVRGDEDVGEPACAAASAAEATSCAGADGETASRRTRRTGARTGAAHAGQAFAGAPGGQPSPARLPFARLRFRIVCAQLRLPRAPGRPERFATVPRADSPSGLCPRCFGGQRKPGKPMRGAALAAIARATPTVAVRNPPVPRAGSTRPAPSPRGSSCRRARCARSASRRRSPSTRAQRTALR